MTARILFYLTACCIFAPYALAQDPDWKAVDAAMGRTSVPQSPDVHSFNFPRSDLQVVVGTVTVKPALALGGWVSFIPHGGETVAMSDLVLTTEELAPRSSRGADRCRCRT